MTTAELTATAGAPSSVPRARSRHHPLLGGLLVREGLINQAQLERVLTLQQEMAPRPLLGQILIDEKLVTAHELNALLGKYQRMHLLGDVLVETKAVTPAQLETALAVQRRTDAPLGETLIRLGLITDRQLKEALGIQLRVPFVDLDARPLEPGLASAVSERYARHHRVLPIARRDDRIVVAMDDPTDVEVVAELRACTGQRIEVVAATAGALERAFARVYGGPLAPPPDRTDLPRRPAAPPAGAGATLDAVRARMDGIRQLARSWERGADAVEALLRERAERRAEFERLTAELRETRARLTRASEELRARTESLERLEAAHDALSREHEARGRALAALQERHDALLREREFALDRIGEALRRLRA
jgi:hypothetical protein